MAQFRAVTPKADRLAPAGDVVGPAIEGPPIMQPGALILPSLLSQGQVFEAENLRFETHAYGFEGLLTVEP